MTTAIMQDLPTGAVFIGPDGTRFRVTSGAADNDGGWVFVWNLSMTDAEAAERLASLGAVDPGVDPRDGFFAYTHPTEVTVP